MKKQPDSDRAQPAASPDGRTANEILRELKETALADSIETKNAITRGDLITRDAFKKIFGDIQGVYSSQVHTLGETLGHTISVYLGAAVHDEAAVREAIMGESYKMMGDIKKTMDLFIRNDVAHYLEKQQEDV